MGLDDVSSIEVNRSDKRRQWIAVGFVFLLTYVGERMGSVIIRAGNKEIKCKMCCQALDDMAVFVHRYYQLKLATQKDVSYPAQTAQVTGMPSPESSL